MGSCIELSMRSHLLGSCLPELESEVHEIWSSWEYTHWDTLIKPPDSYAGEIPIPAECECLEIWGSKERSTKVNPLGSAAPAVVKVCGDSGKINGAAVMQNRCEIGIRHFAFLGDINQSFDLFPGKFYFFLTLSIGLPDVRCYWDSLSCARHSWGPSWFLQLGSFLISIKHWDFPKAFLTITSILAARLCGRACLLLL